MLTLPIFLEALVIVTALSLDAFVSAFAYGTGKIKIPAVSLLVINLICSGTLALALLFGDVLSRFLPEQTAGSICFLLLLMMGLIKVFGSAIKAVIRRHGDFHKKIHFSAFHMGFILKIYANPEEADRDHSRILSPGEAAFLAVALSLDGLAVGFGAGLSCANPLLVVLLSLLIGTLALLLGSLIGQRVGQKLRFDFDWLGGMLLILLAILKLP